MKTVIYYFSGTGNSLKAATELCKELGNCELLPIAACIMHEKYRPDCKRVGFVFPLYYLGLPKLVRDFVKKVDLSNTEYIFTVITRGWPLVGGAIKQMHRLMHEKGRSLDFGAYIHMPMNDFTLAQVPDEKNQQIILGKFKKQIDKVASNIKNNKKKYDFEPISFMLEKRNTPFVNRVNKLDRFYRVNQSCTGCGLCEKACPVDNIHIVDGIPRWNNNCELCLACFHFCPNKAIMYGDKSRDTRRYHHPEVTMQQIMKQKVLESERS